MRAVVRGIDPNDYPGWDRFVSAVIPEPWDHFGWFTVVIGTEGGSGGDLFQVLVTTPAAVSRSRRGTCDFRVLVVDSFEPEVIARAIRDYVASVTGNTWDELVTQLQRVMYWEYEGMPAPQ